VVCALLAVLAAPGTALATPSVTSAPPGFGAIGDTCHVIGSGFGDTQAGGEVIVQPGNLSAPVLVWAHDSIICNVPNGAEATSTVAVKTAEGTSNSVSFWVYDRVWGYVFDGHGAKANTNSVGDAKVELKDRDTDEVLDTAYTKGNGEFWINHVLDKSKRYRLTGVDPLPWTGQRLGSGSLLHLC
jgi:hypothetical protein